MKIYTLIPLVILALVFVGGYFFLPAVELPQAKLDRQIDEQVELAQRMLYQHNAAAPRLEQTFGSSATQPAEIDPEKWRAYQDLDDDTPFASLRERLNGQEQQFRQAARELAQLGGDEPARKSPAGPEQAYAGLMDDLKGTKALLDQAITIVRNAINLQEGSGESEVSGRSHPNATRLETILLRYKADLLRREAALIRSKANLERRQVERLVVVSRDVQDAIAAQNLLLTGGAAAGKAASTQTAAADAQAGAASAETQPEAEQGPADVVPSLPDRIAGLQKDRTDVAARITAGEAEIAKLSTEIQELETRQAAAEGAAREAERKMLEAEQKGANAADPESVQKFVNEYRKLAEAHRKAAREAAMLKEGSVRNARSASADPDEILTSPLVAVDKAQPMAPERGLDAVSYDKSVAEKVLAANKELLAEIDRQIEGLSGRRKSVEAQLAALQDRNQEVSAELARYATAAGVDLVRADALEQEAIEILDGPGQQAARRAQSAASEYQRRTAEFIRSENPVETPDRKLSDMAADQFAAANAVALQGDLSYLLARTYVQRADDLDRHQRMLSTLASLGVSVKLDPEQLPEGTAAESVPAAATNAEEAAKAVTEARQKAAEAAKQALDSYTQAASQLKDLWVVHANIAAVHSLLADLPKVEGDTEDHLTLARQTYARAIQGREQRPEYAAHRRVLDRLNESAKAAQ